MKIAIVGFGREGAAALEFICRRPQYDFARIYILDRNPALKIPAPLKRRPGAPIRLKTGKNYLNKLDFFDLVFRSPGVPYNLPEIQNALKKGTVFSSATKLFFEQCTCRIVGITGTKGKGTTATLVYQMLKNSGFDAYLAGNIGRPALELLPHLKQHSIVVLELSSFQLQDLIISPAMAVVLTIFPDHLDVHASFKEYLDAKINIARFQTPDNALFYFPDDKLSAAIARKSRAKKYPVSPAKFSLFQPGLMKIPGRHNFRNAVMAANVAAALDCPAETIAETATQFTGLEHRLEFVCSITGLRKTIGPAKTRTLKDGVIASFYNDSASTNPQTTIAAIQSFNQPIILIAGGHDKNLDYAPLGAAIRKTKTKLAVLFGGNKLKIKAALKRFPTIVCDDLPTAVAAAVKRAAPGDIIVFSPGAASFDMFQDYSDRGRKFKEFVLGLK